MSSDEIQPSSGHSGSSIKNQNSTNLELPSWFDQDSIIPSNIMESPRALASFLGDCRRDILTSLSLYQAHVRYGTSIIFSVVAAIIVIFSAVLKGPINFTTAIKIERIAAALLAFTTLLIIAFIYITTKYHNFFVSVLLFGTQAHFRVAAWNFRWFEIIVNFLADLNSKNKSIYKKDISKKEFIDARTWRKRDSHYWYTIVHILLLFGCVVGIVYFLSGPFSGPLKCQAT